MGKEDLLHKTGLRSKARLAQQFLEPDTITKMRVNESPHRRNLLRRNPIEDGTISGFSGQKSVPELF